MKRLTERVEEARRRFKNDKRVVFVRCDAVEGFDFLLVCRVLRESKRYVVEMLVEQYDQDKQMMRLKMMGEKKYGTKKEAERDVLARFEREDEPDFLVPIRD